MAAAGKTITGTMVTSLVVLGVAVYGTVAYERDGGFYPYGPPRYRPDLLKKEREKNPYEVKDRSMRQNRIPLGQTLLSVDAENLHLYGIK